MAYKYGLKYSFSGDMDRLEDWLQVNCHGDYTYEFQDIKETGAVFNKLEILFRFEHEDDRESFKRMITSGASPW